MKLIIMTRESGLLRLALAILLVMSAVTVWAKPLSDDETRTCLQLIGFSGVLQASPALADVIKPLYEGEAIDNQTMISSIIGEIEIVAEEGEPFAQSLLGTLYRIGGCVEQDGGVAEKWLKRAAQAGNTRAMNELAMMYYEGKVVSQDFVEGTRWIIQAAEAGDMAAVSNAARSLGPGSPQEDLVAAYKWVLIENNRARPAPSRLAFEEKIKAALSAEEQQAAEEAAQAWMAAHGVAPVARMTAAEVEAEKLQRCVEFFDSASPRNPQGYDDFLQENVPQLAQLLANKDYRQILKITLDHGEAGDKNAQVALMKYYKFRFCPDQDEEKADYWFHRQHQTSLGLSDQAYQQSRHQSCVDYFDPRYAIGNHYQDKFLQANIPDLIALIENKDTAALLARTSALANEGHYEAMLVLNRYYGFKLCLDYNKETADQWNKRYRKARGFKEIEVYKDVDGVKYVRPVKEN